MPQITPAQIALFRRLCEAGTGLIKADQIDRLRGDDAESVIADLDEALTDAYGALAQVEGGHVLANDDTKAVEAASILTEMVQAYDIERQGKALGVVSDIVGPIGDLRARAAALLGLPDDTAPPLDAGADDDA